MEIQIIKNERTAQQYTYIKHPSGLDIMVWRMEGFRGCEALFGTKYGSLNTRFKTDEDEDFVSVPEGIAHFLEHKLFENEDCDAFELYAKTGASANAYTSFDKTVYYFECTKNFSDSLEILLNSVQQPYFTKETVEKEQGIIGQEIKMCEDNVNRAVYFNMLKCLYVNHPIRIDIAGTVESIAQIDADLLYRCYNTFYNLHNMLLAVAGNVTVEEVLEVADRCLKPSRDIKLQSENLPEPDEVAKKEITVQMECGVPLFAIGYKIHPSEGKEGIRETSTILPIIAQLLGDSSSELYNSMLEEGLVNNSFGAESFGGEGFLSLNFVGESKDPHEVYRRINEAILKLQRDGINRRHLELIKKSTHGGIIRAFNNVDAVASIMIDTKMAGTDPFETIEFLAEVTAEDIEEFLRNKITLEHSAISIVEPTAKQ